MNLHAAVQIVPWACYEDQTPAVQIELLSVEAMLSWMMDITAVAKHERSSLDTGAVQG